MENELLISGGTYVFVPVSMGADWEGINSSCIVNNDSIDFHIDLSKTINPPLNLSAGAWLQLNSEVINYGRSYPYIADVHILKDPEEYIDEDLGHDSLTLQQLRSLIESQVDDFAFDVEANNYKKYIKLSFDANNKIKIKVESGFHADQNNYSIALFKSILVVGTPKGQPVFDFFHGKGEHHLKVFIRMEGERTYFYDFSHHP